MSYYQDGVFQGDFSFSVWRKTETISGLLKNIFCIQSVNNSETLEVITKVNQKKIEKIPLMR